MLVGEIDLVAGRDSEGNATGRGSFNSEGAFIAAANGGQFGSISGETTLEAAEYDRYSKSSGWGIGLSFGGTPVANAVDTLMKGDSLEDAYAQNSKTYSALKALSGSSVGETKQGLINASLQVRGSGNALLDAFNSDKDGAFEKAFNQQFNPFKDMGTGKDATGKPLTPTVTVGFNTFKKSSEWSQSTATSIATGGDLEIMSGQNDGGHNLNIMDGTQFSIGGDPFVNFKGVDLSGVGSIELAVEGQMTIESQQEHHESESSNLGLNVSLTPTGGIGQVGVSGSNQSGSRDEVTQQSYLSVEKATGYVREGIKLIGAGFTSDTPSEIETPSVTVVDIENYADHQGSSLSAGYNFGPTPPKPAAPASGTAKAAEPAPQLGLPGHKENDVSSTTYSVTDGITFVKPDGTVINTDHIRAELDGANAAEFAETLIGRCIRQS